MERKCNMDEQLFCPLELWFNFQCMLKLYFLRMQSFHHLLVCRACYSLLIECKLRHCIKEIGLLDQEATCGAFSTIPHLCLCNCLWPYPNGFLSKFRSCHRGNTTSSSPVVPVELFRAPFEDRRGYLKLKIHGKNIYYVT